MNFRILPTIVIALFLAIPVRAHRTDGLLQSSLVEILPSQVGVQVTLAPGIDIAPKVIALLDSDRDGVFSDPESEAWSELFMAKQRVTVDGQSLPLTLQSVRTSPLAEMRDGHAEIVVNFTADPGAFGHGPRTIVCVNRYEPMPSAYQSNGLVPKAPGVRITSHRRDERQRELTLDVEFLEAAAPAPASPGHSSTAFGWFVVLGTTGAIVAGVSGRRRLMAPPQRPKSA